MPKRIQGYKRSGAFWLICDTCGEQVKNTRTARQEHERSERHTLESPCAGCGQAPQKCTCLPPDPEGQNDHRAEWAATALAAFRAETGADECDAVCDLLANLMHWCDRNGQDFSAELRRGTMHYRAETSPDPDGFADKYFPRRRNRNAT